MDHAVKLTINGETREFPMGITYKEVVKEYENPIPSKDKAKQLTTINVI